MTTPVPNPHHWRLEPRSGGAWSLVKDFYGGSTTRIYITLREAEEAWALMHRNGKCRECGDVLDTQVPKAMADRIVHEQCCLDCLEWLRIVEDKDSGRCFTATGHHYTIAPDESKGREHLAGFGGARFRILFSDGREVVSRNIWHTGKVPAHFRERLPDNAVMQEE